MAPLMHQWYQRLSTVSTVNFMNEESLKQHHQIIVETWQLLKSHSDIQDTDEYWEQLVNEATEIYERYKTKFAKDMVIAVLNELERERNHDEHIH